MWNTDDLWWWDAECITHCHCILHLITSFTTTFYIASFHVKHRLGHYSKPLHSTSHHHSSPYHTWVVSHQHLSQHTIPLCSTIFQIAPYRPHYASHHISHCFPIPQYALRNATFMYSTFQVTIYWPHYASHYILHNIVPHFTCSTSCIIASFHHIWPWSHPIPHPTTIFHIFHNTSYTTTFCIGPTTYHISQHHPHYHVARRVTAHALPHSTPHNVPRSIATLCLIPHHTTFHIPSHSPHYLIPHHTTFHIPSHTLPHFTSRNVPHSIPHSASFHITQRSTFHPTLYLIPHHNVPHSIPATAHTTSFHITNFNIPSHSPHSTSFRITQRSTFNPTAHTLPHSTSHNVPHSIHSPHST